MRVYGQVTDLETKEPVAEALVRLSDHESVLVEAITGADGRYDLQVDLAAKPKLVGRPAQVKATKEGYEPSLADFQLEEGELTHTLTLHNRPETLVVFVNKLDGSPLPEAEVLFTMGKSVLQTSLTDEQGLASWTVPAHRLDQQALLKLSKDGWYKVERLVLLRRDQPRVQVTLEPSTTGDVPLTGRVFDEKGMPLPGAKVRLEIPRMDPVELVTNEEGRWTLMLESDFYGGEALLTAEHPDYHTALHIKMPLMPNAMHVVPMNPLKAPTTKRPLWMLIAAAVVVLGFLTWAAIRIL